MFTTIAKIASYHDIKMVMPATIWIGKNSKCAYIHTDALTGYVKVNDNEFDIDDINRFIKDRMMIDRKLSNTNADKVPPPRFILKLMSFCSEESIY